MWFIGVEVQQETSEPPPKKILDPPLQYFKLTSTDFREGKLATAKMFSASVFCQTMQRPE